MKILDVPQSGSIAGQTSSRNRFGQYRRTRSVPVNPNTPAQSDVRATLADVSKRWSGLTDAQRDAWNYYALANPRVDPLGQSIVLTGLQMYVSLNTLLVTAGFTTTDAAPSGTPVTAPLIDIDDASIAAPVQLGFTPTPIPVGQALVLFTSPPVSPGTNFNGDYRIVTVIAAGTVSPESIGATLVTKWGTLLPGMKFFMRAKLLSITGTNKGVTSADSNIVSGVLTA